MPSPVLADASSTAGWSFSVAAAEEEVEASSTASSESRVVRRRRLRRRREGSSPVAFVANARSATACHRSLASSSRRSLLL